MILEPTLLLARASGIGALMPSSSQKVQFTDTQIRKLVEMYNSFFFERYEEINSKYLTKGNEQEDTSITLLSTEMKKMFVKNTQRLSNEYITGEWDLQEEEDGKIIHTLDTKSSWSKNTFDETRVKKLNTDYWWQGQSYMWLTGAKKHTVAYCLVNGTYTIIMDEIRRLGWKMGILDGDLADNPVYEKKIQQIERNHIFDLNSFMSENPHYDIANRHTYDGDVYSWEYDVPSYQRVHKITFERDEMAIEKMKARVNEIRSWVFNNLILTLKQK